MIKKFIYQPSAPIPPGETLLELLNVLKISQTDLARRMGRPLKLINEIIKGKAMITPETALQLEQVLGKPASFWNNLETGYQEARLRIETEESLKKETVYASKYPYNAMAKWGWVAKTKNSLEKVKNLLSFFGVTSLEIVAKEAVQYRISSKKQYSNEAVAAWLRRGSLLAQEIDTKPYSEKDLKNIAEEIPRMTSEDINKAIPLLQTKLANCGVAFVVTQSLPKAPVNGASRWPTPERALIQLSLYMRWYDTFWFSVCHEIGHILLHGKKELNIAPQQDGKNELEIEADNFAQRLLIRQADFANFVRRADYSAASVRNFAKEAGIDPGIVVGRLQHEKMIHPSHLNGLRTRYTWTAEA